MMPFGKFYRGETALQVLSRQGYAFLKKSHDFRIDNWSRTKNISWCGTMLLRHALSFEHRQAVLRDDATMDVNEFLSFDMCRHLKATYQDVEQMLRDQDPGKIRFFEVRDDNGTLTRIGAVQGHSGRAQSMINTEAHLTRAFADDGLVHSVMLHGTQKQFVSCIRTGGLKAGGDHGQDKRTHIHLVANIETTGARAGVRSGSDYVVKVDMERYMADGGECFWSRNNVLLTEGMWINGVNKGIPPKYILEIVDRHTGEKVHPQSAPKLDARGRARSRIGRSRSREWREAAEKVALREEIQMLTKKSMRTSWNGNAGMHNEVASKKRLRDAARGSRVADEDEETRKAQRRCERFGIQNLPQLPEEPQITLEAASEVLNIRRVQNCTFEMLDIFRQAALADVDRNAEIEKHKISEAYRVLIHRCRNEARPGAR
jgi:RNA:NAD 2'-phosphotransferase (TPT1/KptA family)